MDDMHNTIYVKTAAGQRQVVESNQLLPIEQRRLLMLCNGYTPFAHLAERLRVPEPQRARDALLAMGLIEEAARPVGTPTTPSGWMNLDA